jgi:putative endonuclease
MYYVYIIKSINRNCYYKGFTENPILRLHFHNEGKSTYTSKSIPWKLVALFGFETKSEALTKEKRLKKYPTKSLEALINSNRNSLTLFLDSLEKC